MYCWKLIHTLWNALMSHTKDKQRYFSSYSLNYFEYWGRDNSLSPPTKGIFLSIKAYLKVRLHPRLLVAYYYSLLSASFFFSFWRSYKKRSTNNHFLVTWKCWIEFSGGMNGRWSSKLGDECGFSVDRALLCQSENWVTELKPQVPTLNFL